jgi:hypothetical protein
MGDSKPCCPPPLDRELPAGLVLGNNADRARIEGSTFTKNFARGGISEDLVDGNPNCGSNTWKSNDFLFAFPADCIQ